MAIKMIWNSIVTILKYSIDNVWVYISFEKWIKFRMEKWQIVLLWFSRLLQIFRHNWSKPMKGKKCCFIIFNLFFLLIVLLTFHTFLVWLYTFYFWSILYPEINRQLNCPCHLSGSLSVSSQGVGVKFDVLLLSDFY